MILESIILRENPKLEFVFNKNNFEIVSTGIDNISGIYLYELLESIGIEKRKINWGITILSFISEVILQTNSQSAFRKKSKLKFNYNNEKIEILLKDCDFEKAELINEKLNLKLKK